MARLGSLYMIKISAKWRIQRGSQRENLLYNDTIINDNFSSVQQNIAGINTTIQNVEENLRTEIKESANGFNVNIQKYRKTWKMQNLH